MVTNDDRIRHAVEHTEILRAPKQSLYTFGTTNIHYYLVTEPVYSELVNDITETIVREGRVIAERPKIVTRLKLSQVYPILAVILASSEARRYFEALVEEHGANIRGLFYTYKNEPKELTIVSDNLLSVVEKINAEIDRRGDPLMTIIKGEDQFWDVSLMKFIYEMTRSSLQDNLRQMGSRGLLNMDTAGIPLDARIRINELFQKVARGESDPSELKDELDRWGLFEEYQDRFFSVFRKRR